MEKHHVLYSFRRCPYAMRARLALHISEQPYEHREILLKNKPKHLLELSPKGTVPVLCTSTGQVIDESLEIMKWALSQRDPQRWLSTEEGEKKIAQDWIQKCDVDFKPHLDLYKYFERYPETSPAASRERCEVFLSELDRGLEKSKYLIQDHMTIADAAILPFVRQMAHCDKEWFFNSDYSNVATWLLEFMNSEIFEAIMKKYPLYSEEGEPIFVNKFM